MNYVSEMAYSDGYIEGVMMAMEESYASESYYYGYATEGVNYTAGKMNRNYGKEIGKLVNESNRLYKEGDISGAKAKLLEAADISDKLADEVENLDQNAGTAILGALAYSVKMGIMYAGTCAIIGGLGFGVLGAKLGAIGGGIGGTAASLLGVGLGSGIAKVIEICSKEKFLKPKDYNIYTTIIIQEAEKLADTYRRMAKKM